MAANNGSIGKRSGGNLWRGPVSNLLKVDKELKKGTSDSSKKAREELQKKADSSSKKTQEERSTYSSLAKDAVKKIVEDRKSSSKSDSRATINNLVSLAQSVDRDTKRDSTSVPISQDFRSDIIKIITDVSSSVSPASGQFGMGVVDNSNITFIEEETPQDDGNKFGFLSFQEPQPAQLRSPAPDLKVERLPVPPPVIGGDQVDREQKLSNRSNVRINQNNSDLPKPSIILISKFNKLVKSSFNSLPFSLVNQVIPIAEPSFSTGDFKSGDIFKQLTPEGQYFDLQIQSKYLDYLAIQKFYNDLSDDTKTKLSEQKEKNKKLIDTLKVSAESLKSIYNSLDSSKEIFDYSELIQSLISANLLSDNTGALEEWDSLKTWHQYVAAILNSISGKDRIVNENSWEVSLNDPELWISEEKKLLVNYSVESKISEYLDTNLKIENYNQEDFRLFPTGRLGGVEHTFFTKSSPKFSPYKIFQFLSQELLFSANNADLNSNSIKSMLGYNEYGTYNVVDIPVDYATKTIGSAPGVKRDVDKEGTYLAGTFDLSDWKLGDGAIDVKSGYDYFIVDSVGSVDNQGVIQTDRISRLKNKIIGTANQLEKFKSLLYRTTKIDDSLLPYIHDPINRIIKDLTTEDSTTEKLVFTDAQSLNSKISGENALQGFETKKELLAGEPWVIGLIKWCYYSHNNKNNPDEPWVPAMWHLLNALLSNSDEAVETLIKDVIFLQIDGGINTYSDPKDIFTEDWADRPQDAKLEKNRRRLRTEMLNQRDSLINSFSQSEVWAALKKIMNSYKTLLSLSCVDGKTKINSIHDMYFLYLVLTFAVSNVIEKMPWKLNIVNDTWGVGNTKDDWWDSDQDNVGDVNERWGINKFKYRSIYPTKVIRNDGKLNIQKLDSLISQPLDLSSYDSNDSGESKQVDFDITLSYANPQKMIDKLILFLYKKREIVENLEREVITSQNLIKLSELFVTDNIQLKDIFNFSSTQVFSILSRLTDLETNFNKVNNVNLLNHPIITTQNAKVGIYNTIKKFPYGNILTVGIPKNLFKTSARTGQKIIKFSVSRVNELDHSKVYPKLQFMFDLNTFLVWDFDKFYGSGPTLRKFNSNLEIKDFNNSTSQYIGLSDTAKKNILNNHKLSAELDLYLSTLTGLQVDETSVFDKNVTDMTPSNGFLANLEVRTVVSRDPLLRTRAFNYNTVQQSELFLKTLNTFSEEKMIKLFTTSPPMYDRIFNIFIPVRDEDRDTIWEYQVELELEDEEKKKPILSNGLTEEQKKPIGELEKNPPVEVNIGLLLDGLNPEIYTNPGFNIGTLANNISIQQNFRTS